MTLATDFVSVNLIGYVLKQVVVSAHNADTDTLCMQSCTYMCRYRYSSHPSKVSLHLACPLNNIIVCAKVDIACWRLNNHPTILWVSACWSCAQLVGEGAWRHKV